MAQTFGAPPDFALELPVEAEPLHQVEEMLADLGVRRTDSRRNATTFTSAVPAVDPDDYFRVSDLRRHVPGLDENAGRRIDHVLDSGVCDVEGIRRQLIEGNAHDAAAVVLEIGEIEPGEDRHGYDIAALSLVGSEFAVPVGLARADFPGEKRPDVAVLEQQMATELLLQLGDDLAAIGAPLPPLLSFDARYGENHQLRRHARELGFESLLPIGEDFDEASRPRRIGEPLRERLLMSERMPYGPGGAVPRPEVYSMTAAPHEREYLFGLPGPIPEYAVVFPGVFSGTLTGRRGLDRGAELVSLARSVHPPRVVEHLRLLRFLHLNPVGWSTAAYLLAAYWAALLGRLPPPTRR